MPSKPTKRKRPGKNNKQTMEILSRLDGRQRNLIFGVLALLLLYLIVLLAFFVS